MSSIFSRNFPVVRGAALVIMLLLIRPCFAQNQAENLDSLLTIVDQKKGDTTEIRALIMLGIHYSGKDTGLSFGYLQKALALSEKLDVQEQRIDILNELGALYHKQGDYDSSLFFHHQALHEAVSENRSFQLANTYHLIGLTFLRMVKQDSARSNLAKALSIATEKKYYTLQSDIYVVLGNTFLEEGNDEEALTKFIMAAKLQDSLIHDPQGESRALLNIANIQYRLGDMDKAIAYAREAQPLAEKANYDRGLAYATQLLGRIYRKQKKFDESLSEYNQALAVYKRMGDNRSMAETLQNIGNTFYDKGSIHEAGQAYYDALKIARGIGNPTLFTYTYASIGYFYYTLKQYDRAIAYTDSSRLYAEKTGDLYSVLDAYELLTLIKEEQGDYKNALEFFRKATELSDSLTREENRVGIAELEMEYQNDKKQKEIALLKKDQEVQKLELREARANRIIFIVALISVIVISLLLVNRYRTLNQSRRAIEMERMRNSIARDLHDDIGSTLSSINIMSQLALTENGNAAQHLKKIATHSAQMMENMSDIVWSINPKNDKAEQMVFKMKEFAAEILEPAGINYSFHFDQPLEHLKLDSEKRKNLFLIFKEAINNTAKYSGGTDVTISLSIKGARMHLSIIDNGNGFSEEAVRQGNGLINMRERATSVGGTLVQTSSPGKGTSIELEIPIT